jgi:ubiquinone/menaquinone biosynthesis C-methylase UbiE
VTAIAEEDESMFSATRFDELAPPSHDELARQEFVSMLRKRIMVDMAGRMREVYRDEVEPGYVAAHGRAPRDGREVRKAMLPNPYFKAWSALRYSAQELTWWSVMPQVERQLPALVETARRAAHENPAGGSLRLDPSLPIPKEVESLDIHLMPGCYHTEHVEDDVAAGAVYTYGTSVFGGALKLRTPRGGVAASIARWLRITRPDLRPATLLDLGCTTGNNLFPYLEVFPDCVGYGVDVGAPLLRYAHARAETLGLQVHFSQQRAESLDFADDTFDLVVSSFFLHEISTKSTRQVLREAYRVLKPGGVMVHMELPPSSETDPYYSFYLDWDAYYNNEPHYAAFRALDFRKEVTAAGFAPKNYFQRRIPNFGTIPDAEFEASCRGEIPAPAHGNGASWFVFGATK